MKRKMMRSVLDGDTSDHSKLKQKWNPKQDLMIAYLFSIRRPKNANKSSITSGDLKKNYLKKIEKNCVSNLYK